MNKLTEHGVQCRWLAPDESSAGYRIYWPTAHKITTERNVRMLFGIEEEKFNTSQPLVEIGPPEYNASTTPPQPARIKTIPEDNSDQPLATRRTRRTITAPTKLTYTSVNPVLPANFYINVQQMLHNYICCNIKAQQMLQLLLFNLWRFRSKCWTCQESTRSFPFR